jgi:peptidoglycan/LPS O-acetylase OafA/YrhL
MTFPNSKTALRPLLCEHETTPVDYYSARIARIYSVLLPAIAVTFVLDRVGAAMAPGVYSASTEGWYAPTAGLGNYALALIFLNEIWFVHLVAGTNSPTWSLTLEVWYYLIFGIMFFCPRKLAVFGGILVFIIVGPKLILLAPCWFLGVAASYLARYRLSILSALALSVAPIVAIVVLMCIPGDKTGANQISRIVGFNIRPYLWNSEVFLRLTFVSLMTAIHFVGMHRALQDFRQTVFSKIISQCAQFTYSIYLFHYPIKFFVAAIPAIQGYYLRPYIIFFSAIFFSIALGLLFEPMRRPLRSAISSLLMRPGSNHQGAVPTSPLDRIN